MDNKVKKKVMECVTLPTSNKYYPIPYEVGEKVIFLGNVKNDGKHPQSFYDQFIKIFRIKNKRKETVLKINFEFVKN